MRFIIDNIDGKVFVVIVVTCFSRQDFGFQGEFLPPQFSGVQFKFQELTDTTGSKTFDRQVLFTLLQDYTDFLSVVPIGSDAGF